VNKYSKLSEKRLKKLKSSANLSNPLGSCADAKVRVLKQQKTFFIEKAMTERTEQTEEQQKFRYKAGAFLVGVAGVLSALLTLLQLNLVNFRHFRCCWVRPNIGERQEDRSQLLQQRDDWFIGNGRDRIKFGYAGARIWNVVGNCRHGNFGFCDLEVFRSERCEKQ
jgi:hypothetical protein